jgi:hypothetical protein
MNFAPAGLASLPPLGGRGMMLFVLRQAVIQWHHQASLAPPLQAAPATALVPRLAGRLSNCLPACLSPSHGMEPRTSPPPSAIPKPPTLWDLNDVANDILSYLSAPDLCRLSCCSREHYKIASTKSLWTDLTIADFLESDIAAAGSACPESWDGLQRVWKHKYKLVKESVCAKIGAAKDIRQRIEYEERLEKKLALFERCLDLTQFRLLITLPPISLLASLILFGLKFDGASYSMWFCFLPLFVTLGYVALCILVSMWLCRQQHRAGSPLQSTWQLVSGPLNWTYENLIKSQSRVSIILFSLTYFLVSAQLVLLGLKLSSDVSALRTSRHFEWGVVFLPLWLLFALFCAIPIAWQVNGTFIVVVGLVWIPLLIVLVLLAIKLNDGPATDRNNFHLDLILIPFWIIEGIFLLGASVFLGIGYLRYEKLHFFFA